MAKQKHQVSPDLKDLMESVSYDAPGEGWEDLEDEGEDAEDNSEESVANAEDHSED